jgi:hypothetical protein
MKYVVCCLVTLFAASGVLHSQQRPTLGPSEPSMRGPGSSRTANPRMLLRMRKIYIQRIDNNLNERLADDLAHVSWVKVVDKPEEADAIVRGTCFDLRRLKRLHAEVYISDRVSGKSIWQDVIRVPYNPPGLPKAVADAATEILAHLNQSIHAAANPQRRR